MSAGFWIILTAILVSSSASILGCFLVLRQSVMMGDAISHAILPGLVLAFFISGSRDSIPMLLGAACVGVLATIGIEWLSRKFRIQNDASMGIVFTFLFALGIILITLFADRVDLDADCVLHGEIIFVPMDRWITPSGVNMGPVKVWILSGVFLLTLTVIIIGFKGFFITSFDPFYASSIGISLAFWHYVLMSLVSLVSVVSFDAVGAVLVVAFLAVPAATAYLLTDNLKKMIWISVLVGVCASIGGYYFSSLLDANIPGAITAVLGFMFLLALLFNRWRTNTSLRLKDMG